MEYYSVIKIRNSAVWDRLNESNCITLSEIRQRKTNIAWSYLYVELKIKNTKHTQK